MSRTLDRHLTHYDESQNEIERAVRGNMCLGVAARDCFSSDFLEIKVASLEFTAGIVREGLEPLYGYVPCVNEVCMTIVRNEREQRMPHWPEGLYFRYVYSQQLRSKASLIVASYRQKMTREENPELHLV